MCLTGTSKSIRVLSRTPAIFGTNKPKDDGGNFPDCESKAQSARQTARHLAKASQFRAARIPAALNFLLPDFYFSRFVFNRDRKRAAAFARARLLRTVKKRPLPFHHGVIDFRTLI